LYLTVEEAAAYTGLGVTHLSQQIPQGKLNLNKGAGPRGADMTRRTDLSEI
jgi:hypothetical protein